MTHTLDPANCSPLITLSNFDLTATANTGGHFVSVLTTPAPASGKWYFEVTLNNNGKFAGGGMVGFGNAATDLDADLGFDTNSFGLSSSSGFSTAGNVSGTPLFTPDWFSSGSVLGVAVDIVNRLCWFRDATNGWTGDPTAGTNSIDMSGLTGTLFPALSVGDVNTQMTLNFGAQTLSYSPPTGYALPDATFSGVAVAGTLANGTGGGVALTRETVAPDGVAMVETVGKVALALQMPRLVGVVGTGQTSPVSTSVLGCPLRYRNLPLTGCELFVGDPINLWRWPPDNDDNPTWYALVYADGFAPDGYCLQCRYGANQLTTLTVPVPTTVNGLRIQHSPENVFTGIGSGPGASATTAQGAPVARGTGVAYRYPGALAQLASLAGGGYLGARQSTALVQALTGAPDPTQWRAGAALTMFQADPASAPLGAAIATFNTNNLFDPGLDGGAHAAILTGLSGAGITVVEQYPSSGGVVTRVYPWTSPGKPLGSAGNYALIARR